LHSVHSEPSLPTMLSSASASLRLGYALDNLVLLDQKGTDDAIADALVATRASIGTLDGPAGLGEPLVSVSVDSGESVKHVSTVAAVRSTALQLLVLELSNATGGTDDFNIIAVVLVGVGPQVTNALHHSCGYTRRS